MSLFRWQCCVCFAASVACTESAPRQEQATSSADAQADAAREPADGAQDTEEGLKTIELEPVSPDEKALWQNATEFELGFRQDACLGPGCFRYETTLDASGHLYFTGTRGVARPGTYDMKISADDARSLYSQLLELGYLGLKNRYTTRADGCSAVFTDNPAFLLHIQIPERAKDIEYYGGCVIQGPADDALRAIVKAIQHDPALEHFIFPAPTVCAPWAENAPPQSYVLIDPRANPVGVLRFQAEDDRIRKHPWEVLNCDGDTLLTNASSGEYGCDALLIPSEGATFTWPGVDRPVNAALLHSRDENAPLNGGDGDIVLRLMDAVSEVTLLGHVGTTCSSAK
jgi:hypothetical protein